MSEEDPCVYCSTRNLPCIKVWGPKKRTIPESSGTRSEVTIIPAQLSLLTDSELSGQHLSFLRRLHENSQNTDNRNHVTILLQNLWDTYGLTSIDRTLFYAAPAFACVRMNCKKTEDHYLTFISQFHKHLLFAIRRRTISEVHLFAVYLVLITQRHPVYDRDFELVHTRGIVSVLKSTLENYEQSDSARRTLSRHSSLVVFILPWLSCIVLYDLATRQNGDLTLLYELQGITRKLYTEARIGNSLHAYRLPRPLWRDPSNIVNWGGLWTTTEELAERLFIAFQGLFGQNRWLDENIHPDHAGGPIQSIISVERDIMEMLNLPCVTEIYQSVIRSYHVVD